jgi:diguanylate cyclase (GGDEF)-like protein
VLLHSLVGPSLQPAVVLALAGLGLLLSLRLAHLLRAARSQKDVRYELAQSNALIEFSHTLAGVSDLEATFEAVVRLARRSLSADGAAILLLSDGGHAIDLRAHTGLAWNAGPRRFPVEQSFAAYVMSSGEARNFVSSRSDNPFRAEERALTGDTPFAMAPLLCRADAIGALCCTRETVFAQGELELLGALADHAALAIQNAQLFEQVQSVSLKDPLTGLANRRQIEQDLGREFAAARRGRRLVAVMLDLNNFKAYNDRFGHLAGDQVLRALANVLADETRAMNPAGRYGGDEFVTLLTDTDALGGEIFVQRIRSRFAEATAGLGQSNLTVSAGIAEYGSEMTNPAHLLAAADLALYASKGRRAST